MFSLLIPIPLALFLALFIVSVFADRVFHADRLAEWSFGLSGISLALGMGWLKDYLFLGTPTLEVFESGLIEFVKWKASGFGGWSVLIATDEFCFAMAAGVMFLLAWFVDAAEQVLYGFIALLGLVWGLVFLLGFFVFFEGLALILGLVATIIGIMVGLRKLDSWKTG